MSDKDKFDPDAAIDSLMGDTPNVTVTGAKVGFTPTAAAPAAPVASAFDPNATIDSLLGQSPASSFAPPVPLHRPLSPTEIPDRYEGMGDYMMMPELRNHALTSLNAFLGLVSSDRDSVEDILKKNFPDVEIHHDNGNLVLKSKDDGKKYVFRKGSIQGSDLGRLAASIPVMAAGTAVAGGAAALSPVTVPATAVGIAGTGLGAYFLGKLREHAGGEAVGPREVLTAMALDGLFRSVGSAGRYLKGEAPKPPGGAGTLVPGEGTAIPPTGTEIPVTGLPEGVGSPPAEVPPSAPVPSAPAPQPAPPWEPPVPYVNKSLQSFNEEAEQVMKKVTRVLDRSQQNALAKGELQKDLASLAEKVESAFAPVDKTMKGKDVVAERTLQYLAELEKELGGLPKELVPIREALRPTAAPEGPTVWPKYGALDQVRKRVGAILKNLNSGNPNPEFTVSQAQAKGIYGPLLEDQVANIEKYAPGMGEDFRTAQALSKAEKELGRKVRERLGKQLIQKPGVVPSEPLRGELVAPIQKSLKPLSEKGATSDFAKAVDLVPPRIRSDTIMSGIASNFGDLSAGEGIDLSGFNKWFKGILSNEESRKALFSNLDPAAREGLKDIFRISEEAFGQKAKLEAAKEAAEVALTAKKAELKAAQKALALEVKGKIIQSSKELKKGVKAVSDSLEAARELERASQADVRAATKRLKDLAKQNPLTWLADKVSFVGDKLGFESRVAYSILRSNALRRISPSPVFERLMKAYNVPKPRWQEVLEKSLAMGIPGPVQAGMTPLPRREND